MGAINPKPEALNFNTLDPKLETLEAVPGKPKTYRFSKV